MRDEFIMMPIPASAYTAVCALLGGVGLAAHTTRPAPVVLDKPQPDPNREQGEPQPDPAALAATGGDTGGADELDAHGWPWSADMHASTKGKTKEGLWRMKVGVARPDPKPGFPSESGPTGTSGNGAGSEAGGSANTANAASPAGSNDEDDEFAAFRAAAAESDAKDAAAAASAPARKWSDADLGALCNQAAVKLGDPAPIKAVIAKFTPEGQVAHSRNIPDDQRAAFAAEVEKAAGITFAG